MSVAVVDFETGEVVTDVEVLGDDYLEELASTVRREFRRGREAIGEAVDAQFAIGHALLAARRVLASDNELGAWLRMQEFGFDKRWALQLRWAAEYEDDVREVVRSQLRTGAKTANIDKAVKQVRAALGRSRS